MEHQYLDSNGLAIIAKHVNARLKTVSEMPAASEKLGVCLYTGETSNGYVKGHIYQSVVEGEAYTWKDVTPLPEAPIVVKGTIAAEDLPDPSGAAVGDMYNISNDFTTTDAFIHPGVFEKAGSNVYCIEIEQGEGDSKTTVKKWDVFAMFITDQSYDAESTSAQSGVAVAQAVADRLHAVKMMPSFAPQGEVIAYIGENTSDYIKGHLYQASTALTSNEWATSDISNPTGVVNGRFIWADCNNNVYYSDGVDTNQYILKNNSWVPVVWEGLDKLDAQNVWTDNEDTFYVNYSTRKMYILEKGTFKWTYAGSVNGAIRGSHIWTDGENIYCSYSMNNSSYSHYKFNKSTSEWTQITTWNSNWYISGDNIWTDGEKIYCSTINSSYQYIFDKDTLTWAGMTWSSESTLRAPAGSNIWTDGENIYYSSGNAQHIFDKNKKVWVTKIWEGISSGFSAQDIWFNGNTVHYLYNKNDYMLPLKSSWDDLTIASAPVKTLSDEDVEAVFA